MSAFHPFRTLAERLLPTFSKTIAASFDPMWTAARRRGGPIRRDRRRVRFSRNPKLGAGASAASTARITDLACKLLWVAASDLLSTHCGHWGECLGSRPDCKMPGLQVS